MNPNATRNRRAGRWRSSVVSTLLYLAAPKSWAAAVATALAAGATSAVLGTSVWPWVIGGFGAAIVYFKKQTGHPLDVAVNSVISIAMGGFVAPVAASGLGWYTTPALDNPYAMAFVLSSIWPFVVPILERLFRAWRSSGTSNEQSQKTKTPGE